MIYLLTQLTFLFGLATLWPNIPFKDDFTASGMFIVAYMACNIILGFILLGYYCLTTPTRKETDNG